MVKVDIISGFLGAGKTTLIRKFIEEVYAGEKLVLIENEFGEIGVDGGFLKDAGVEIREMNSGCICCSLVGDFETSLKEVVETYQPERIIIEPSGVGKLSDVMKAVQDVDAQVGLSLDKKIAVVNAKKCKMYVKNFGEFFINQVEHADGIILSRTKDMDQEDVEVVLELLKKYNTKAAIVTTDWEQIKGDAIVTFIEQNKQLEESLLEEVSHHHHQDHHHDHGHGEGCCCGNHHDHHHDHGHGEGCGCGNHHDHHHDHGHREGCGCGNHHDHHHDHHHADDIFTSWGMDTATKYDFNELKGMLEELENNGKYGIVLRAKGMVECENNTWAYFDYVPGEVEVREGIAAPSGKICVIGTNIIEEQLQQLFRN